VRGLDLQTMREREQIVAAVVGSLALEGLTASPQVQRLSEAWARGEASSADLLEAERRLLAGEPLEDLARAFGSNGAVSCG
jgi:hypothetical protein